MQVFTSLVYLIIQVFTYKILLITCKHTVVAQHENSQLEEKDKNFRNESFLISKCCHPHKKLFLIPTTRSYSCIFRTINETTSDFMSINNDEIGLPDCKNSGAQKCLDTLNNRPVELFCAKSSNNGKFYTILAHRPYQVIRKCCPIDKIYDLNEKKCVLSDSQQDLVQQSYLQITKNRLNFMSNSSFVLCDAKKVVVEQSYDINTTDFSIYFDFCLDVSLGFNGELAWMTQTCHSREICHQMPCIRKCCRFGEMSKYENRTSVCVPFEGSIKTDFNKIDNWLEKGQKLEKMEINGKFVSKM